MERFDALDALLDHIWTYAQAAVRERDNALTTPTLATAGPGARTVALRQMNRRERTLVFHTDARSQKVEQLEDEPYAIWLGWDAQLSQQFHLSGRTTVHRDDALADQLWESEPEENLGFYYKSAPPGSHIDAPSSGIDTDTISDEIARTHFVAVRTVVERIDWLHLHPRGEYRARFVWNANAFDHTWVTP